MPPKKVGKRSGSVGKRIGGAFKPKRAPRGGKPKLAPHRRKPKLRPGDAPGIWSPLRPQPMAVGRRRGCCCGLFSLGIVGSLVLVGVVLAGRLRSGSRR